MFVIISLFFFLFSFFPGIGQARNYRGTHFFFVLKLLMWKENHSPLMMLSEQAWPGGGLGDRQPGVLPTGEQTAPASQDPADPTGRGTLCAWRF